VPKSRSAVTFVELNIQDVLSHAPAIIPITWIGRHFPVGIRCPVIFAEL
jgi:hypothetical protein